MLDESIQDMADNITRFLVLSRDPVISAPGDPRPHKTSLAFALPEGPGRLFKALSVFALRSLDICKARGAAQCPPSFRLVHGVGRHQAPCPCVCAAYHVMGAGSLAQQCAGWQALGSATHTSHMGKRTSSNMHCCALSQGWTMQIESRPMRSDPLAAAVAPGVGRRFRYLFYLDVVGNLADPAMQNALRHLQARPGCWP